MSVSLNRLSGIVGVVVREATKKANWAALFCSFLIFSVAAPGLASAQPDVPPIPTPIVEEPVAPQAPEAPSNPAPEVVAPQAPAPEAPPLPPPLPPAPPVIQVPVPPVPPAPPALEPAPQKPEYVPAPPKPTQVQVPDPQTEEAPPPVAPKPPVVNDEPPTQQAPVLPKPSGPTTQVEVSPTETKPSLPSGPSSAPPTPPSEEGVVVVDTPKVAPVVPDQSSSAPSPESEESSKSETTETEQSSPESSPPVAVVPSDVPTSASSAPVTSEEQSPVQEATLPVLKEAAVSDEVKKDLVEKPLQDLKPASKDELAELKDWDFDQSLKGGYPTTTTSQPPTSTTSVPPTTTTSRPPTTTTSRPSTTTSRPPHGGDHGHDGKPWGHRPPVWQHPDYDGYGRPRFYNPRFDVSISIYIRDLAGVSVGVVVVPPRSYVPANVCGNSNYGFAVGVQTPGFGFQLSAGGTFNGYGCHSGGNWRPPPPRPITYVSFYVEHRVTHVPAYFYRERSEYWSYCGCQREYGYVYLRDNGEQQYGYRYHEPRTNTIVFAPQQHRGNPIAGPMKQGPAPWNYPNGGLDPKEMPQPDLAASNVPPVTENTKFYLVSAAILLAAAATILVAIIRRRSGAGVPRE